MNKTFSILAALLLGISAYAQNPVRFDADFECGALGLVELLDSARLEVRPGDTVEHLSYVVHGRFDPANPVDVTLEPSANWYYFRMTGIKGKQIYVNMPDNGLRGTACSFDGKNWQHLPVNEARRHFIDKRFDSDTMFVAMFDPYTYSYHLQRVAHWAERQDVEVDTIGFSGEGRPLQLLHVTDNSVPASKKARVWIHGRIHPSETPGSWLLDGLLERLTDSSEVSASLRKQIDFYILPFTNPDGVAGGLSRSNTTGVNQEVNFGRSADSTVVEVKAMKATFERLTAERPFDVVINNHSQMADFATFWMHRGETSSMAYQAKQWALTGLVSSFNPYIVPEQMSFSDVAPRYCEGWFWNRFAERTVAITLETPYTCYLMNTSGEWVSKENLAAFGRRVLEALAEYLEVSTPERFIVETPSKMAKGWTLVGPDRSHMGENAWSAVAAGAVVKYRLNFLPKGEYELYRFAPGHNVSLSGSGKEKFETGSHGWEFVENFSQRRDGRFKFTVKAPSAGFEADALLLVRKR